MAGVTADGPLRGFTVGVTADQRRDELAGLLARRGARVVLAPALRIVPLVDDIDLHAATLSLVDNPPDAVVACTGVGLRDWLVAADGWGLADALKPALGQAHLIAHGPKARGALHLIGLAEVWKPDSDCC